MIIDHFFSHHIGFGQHLFGSVFFTRFPCEDMVVMLARPMRAIGFWIKIFAQNNV